MAQRTSPWPLLSLVFVSGCASGSGADVARGWPVYGGDFAGTKYSESSRIDRANVHRLRPAWTFHTGDARPGKGSTIECNPLVIGDVMYFTSPSLKVFAVAAASGRKVWEFTPDVAANGVSRGLAYWVEGGDRRLFHTVGPFLYALDAGTGRPAPGFGHGGRIDLREGLDQDVFYLLVTATTPGIVYGDLLILGSSVGEGPSPAAPGHIRAYDVRTGKRRWIFHTIPWPGEPGYETWPPDAWKRIGGVNCWGGFTLDERRGLVFCGTGSASYDHYGGNRIGQNLYANCVLALDARTGALRWHFQVVHHDLWDYDLPCPPILVTVTREGRAIDAVAQVTKIEQGNSTYLRLAI
jgi:quinoprotein glucose dehydrogenase